MRHGKKKAKLNRTSSHRKAMMSNMMTSLFEHESISTTTAKARELRRRAESIITFAKRGDLHSRRQVLRLIANKRVVAKLFDELGPRYADRNGGCIRVVKSEPRRGDCASISVVELVDRPGSRERVEAPDSGGETENEAPEA